MEKGRSRRSAWQSLLAPARVVGIAPTVPAPPVAGATRLIGRALRASGLTRFLRAAASGGAPVTIVVNDPHRATDSRSALRAILEAADRLPRPPRFRLLVAAGSHAFGTLERRRHERAMLGRLHRRFTEVAWHDVRRPGALRRVGPYRLHRLVAESRFILAVGSLEPHYFAGVTGAHKTLTVGVLSLSDLCRNHSRAMSIHAAPLVLEGNPIFDGIRRVLAALERGGRRLFTVNEVLVAGRVVGCSAGPPLRALRRGLPLVRRVHARRTRRPVDLIVARVAPPLDRTLYQADKGIKNVEGAVRDGGVILLEASCRDGVGPDRFLRLLGEGPDEAACRSLVRSRGYRLGDHKAIRLRRLTGSRRVRLGFVSRGISEATARLLHARRFAGPGAAARWALDLVKPASGRAHLTALVVEDAGNVALRIG